MTEEPATTAEESPTTSRGDEADSWLKSPERTRLFTNLTRRVAGVLLFGALAFVVVQFGRDFGLGSTGPRYAVAIILGAITVYLYASILMSVTSARARFRAAQLDVSRGAVDDAIDKLRRSMTLPNLIDLNRKQIEQYHDLTRAEARTSSLMSQIAMSVGFALVVIGGIVAIVSDTTETKIIAGVLGTISAALSTYLSRTYMATHDRALSQLNYFFDQPVITGYLLNAERLAQDVSTQGRDKVLSDMITQLLNAATTNRPSRDTTISK